MLSRRARAGAALAVLIAAVVVGLAAPGSAATGPRGQASRVAVLTGAESINTTEARYQVKGTDLGIMWADDRGQILAASVTPSGLGGPVTVARSQTRPRAIGARTPWLAAVTTTRPEVCLSTTS